MGVKNYDNKKTTDQKKLVNKSLSSIQILINKIIEKPSLKVPLTQHQTQNSITEKMTQLEALKITSDMSVHARENGKSDGYFIRQFVNELVYKVVNNEVVFNNVDQLKKLDTYTFSHSINVCVLAIIIGNKLGLNQKELNILATGSILHDIGKLEIPLKIQRKSSSLTEQEFEKIKLHTVKGYEILFNTSNLDKRAAKIALQHHERWNGDGYPNRLRGNEIDILSRICTIADIYESMTAKRVCKDGISPLDASLYLFDNANVITDPLIMNEFSSSIDIYLGQARALSMDYSDELVKEFYICLNQINGNKQLDFSNSDYMIESRLNTLLRIIGYNKEVTTKTIYTQLGQQRNQLHEKLFKKIHDTIIKNGIELEKEHRNNPVFKNGDIVSTEQFMDKIDSRYIYVQSLISDYGILGEVVHNSLYKEGKTNYDRNSVKYVRISKLRRLNPEF